MAAGSGEVGFDGFFNCAVRVVEHDGGIAFLKSAFGEAPSDLLENDCGCGGGVIDD